MIDSWMRLSCVAGDAVCASGTAALTVQANVVGYIAQRVAADPNMPMYAVEGAHQVHDLTVASADACAAWIALAFSPFRGFGRVERLRPD
jgi:hypothetical protein